MRDYKAFVKYSKAGPRYVIFVVAMLFILQKKRVKKGI